MTTEQRIESFASLGGVINDFVGGKGTGDYFGILEEAVEKAVIYNPWFTPEFLMLSLESIGANLTEENLRAFVSGYNTETVNPKKVAVIMAGNIPLVGFHDFLSVLMSGNLFIGKLSSKDKILLPALARILTSINKEFGEFIRFEDEILKNFDAVIATGSDNSGRYFDYYFGRYPSVIRRNRNSVAVIHPDDNADTYKNIGKDILYYFGLGCRSVSKLYVPEGFDFQSFLDSISDFDYVAGNTKYFNNYEYNKSVFLINRIPHFDNGFLLVKEDNSLSSPISVLHYEYYKDLDNLQRNLLLNRNKLQCIVSSKITDEGYVKPGFTQFPLLTDWADGIDVLDFLCKL